MADTGTGTDGRPLTEPHPDRLAPDHPRRPEILAAHTAALGAGEPGYTDPSTRLFVLTAATLAERGACCDTGCRHCPYVGGPDVDGRGRPVSR
ncbi:MAG: DUF5522 domain-containing protein [Acidimicrobiales bacterium]|jgi:hypothetical protein